MADLPLRVTRMIWVKPAAAASSTTCWITGLSTTGSISLGMALLAGRTRVPRPATGIITLFSTLGFLLFLGLFLFFLPQAQLFIVGVPHAGLAAAFTTFPIGRRQGFVACVAHDALRKKFRAF